MHRPAFRACAYLTGVLLLSLVPHALAQTDPVTISAWARETIELPPGFAPDMPSGVEELRFPPGWRDPDSDNFWSYAIVLRIDEPAPTAARLEEIFDIYYTGLMSAFGVGDKPDSPPNEVSVDFEEAPDRQHRGSMRLVDGFATFKPILIHLKANIRAQSDTESIIELRASPQPDGHAIWTDLQAAIDHIHAEQRRHRLAPLAHLPEGEWRTTPANGVQQRDVWTWGPSKHALTSITSNSEAGGESVFGVFGRFRVIYHHPQRDELTVLALSGPDLINVGTLTLLEGLDLRFDMTVLYDQERIAWAAEPERKISSVWTFHSPTSYTNHWIEDQGQPVDPAATAWSYTKHNEVTPLPPNGAAPPERVTHLGALVPFIGTEWTADGARTTFAWIPYNEAVLMRTIDTRTNEPVAEAIFYPHPHTGVIHSVTIHASGAVDEGTAGADGGAIVIHAEHADDTATARIERRIERLGSDGLRVQEWRIDGAERTLIADTAHQDATD